MTLIKCTSCGVVPSFKDALDTDWIVMSISVTPVIAPVFKEIQESLVLCPRCHYTLDQEIADFRG